MSGNNVRDKLLPLSSIAAYKKGFNIYRRAVLLGCLRNVARIGQYIARLNINDERGSVVDFVGLQQLVVSIQNAVELLLFFLINGRM